MGLIYLRLFIVVRRIFIRFFLDDRNFVAKLSLILLDNLLTVLGKALVELHVEGYLFPILFEDVTGKENV